ncbi:type II toxin-antitoxin system VapC family toxin [Cyanothece sp. BG0011]|uniref:type II toxin-antitoxin system VapC family toxin n=1 Tax=Cyanothece sp. BG0011 TaxID=2082950 RepID=UPI000D1E9891|nr:type II toxin-antitoxin system VapC family toxin [Cyanothece sp. BG0011]
MVHKILVDTDILIDVSRNISTAVNRVKTEEKKAKLSISVITNMELIIGCRNKIELQKLNKFLSRFYILDLNELISRKALKLLSEYRLSHGLLIPDAFIASSAIIFNIPLLTKNQSDYRFISEVNLLPYP